MESVQGGSLKKRRRWLIVVVLATALAGIWWIWPHRDARFVGTWKVHTENHPKSSDHLLELRSSGLARMKWEDGRSVVTVWDVQDGKLVIGSSPQTLSGKLATAASQWLSGKNNSVRLGMKTIYNVEDQSDHSIILTGCLYMRPPVTRTFDSRQTLTRLVQ